MYSAGFAYLCGMGTKEDYDMAEEYLLSADDSLRSGADEDEMLGLVNYYLGVICQDGLTAESDLEEAYNRFKFAAELGEKKAKKALMDACFKNFR
ncbi:MAG: hypothetical protein LUD29_02655 [Clostridia bacterium]|nr:hypothetical protein [Clostridia bacterium]